MDIPKTVNCCLHLIQLAAYSSTSGSGKYLNLISFRSFLVLRCQGLFHLGDHVLSCYYLGGTRVRAEDSAVIKDWLVRFEKVGCERYCSVGTLYIFTSYWLRYPYYRKLLVYMQAKAFRGHSKRYTLILHEKTLARKGTRQGTSR